MSPQFAGSAYPQFLTEAAKYQTGRGNNTYAAHLNKMADQFTINQKERQKLLAEQRGDF